MSNMSDRDIDNLFKKAAENYNTTFDEKAWAAMNDRLEGVKPGPTLGYYKILGVVVGLFILTGLLIGWQSSGDTGFSQQTAAMETAPASPGNEAVVVETTAAAAAEEEEEEEEKEKGTLVSSLMESEDTHEKDNTFIKEKTSSAVDPGMPAVTSGERGTTSSSSRAGTVSSLSTNGAHAPRKVGESKETRSIDFSTGGVDDNEAHPAAQNNEGTGEKVSSGTQSNVRSRENESIVPLNEEPAKGGQPVHDTDPSVDHDNENATSAVITKNTPSNTKAKKSVSEEKPPVIGGGGGQEAPDSLYTLRQDYLHPLDLPGVELHTVETTSPPVENSADEEEETPVRPAFSLKFMLAPDLSSVGYFEPDRPGTNIGLVAEYYLGKRWSISSGVIRSHKIYFSDEREGYGGGSSWNSEWRLDAECTVLDIPINFSYYLKQNERHNLLFTFGFSSYLMLTEDYEYFERVAGNPRTWSERIEGENNHFFSMLNLSFAYEKRLHKNFFFQVEPFVKAPLSGVGEGEVDLVSSGVFLSLKYNFLKR